MAKADFMSKMAEKADISSAKADRMVNAFLETITDALKEGKIARFLGFGSFEVTHVDARPGRNPKTGEAMTTPAHNRVKFVVSKGLKDIVNQH